MSDMQPQRPVLVVGAGASGLACVRHLQRHGAEVRVLDTRDLPPGRAELERLLPARALHFGGWHRAAFDGIGTLVLSPGVDPAAGPVRQAQAAGIEVLGEIELFARAANAPVISISGSNGKSTVTRLAAALLEAAGCRVAVGGNLGTPALELLGRTLDDPAARPDYYVLELSSFQLETTRSLRPAAAALLNISADHLDRHGDMRRYAAIKGSLLQGAAAVVVNRQDARLRPMAAALPPGVPVYRFGLGRPRGPRELGLCRAAGSEWFALGTRRLAPTGRLALVGRHNRMNALAAFGLLAALGLDPARGAAGLDGFAALPHRLAPVGRRGSVLWLDDSKATNVGATLAAVDGLDLTGGARVVLIAGGLGKGQDFRPLARLAPRLRAVVLLGRDAPALQAVFARAGVPVQMVADMAAAAAAADRAAEPGDSVLLAPACASQDMYLDYRARGEDFRAAFAALAAGAPGVSS